MYSVADYDYDLPSELIAQYPLNDRAASRLMVVDRDKQQVRHQQFRDIVQLLNPEDLLILNNTKVFPARLYGQKVTGGSVEVLLERLLDHNRALAHVRASKAPKIDSELLLSGSVTVTVIARHEDLFELQFPKQLALLPWLEKVGEMPLPPYITRQIEQQDRQRYQTVYAEKVGAVAAPTAGLHFTPELLAQCEARGIDIGYLTLHVGAGTFQPIRVEHIDQHKMHAEAIEVNEALCQQIAQCRQRRGRVVAVGTTVMRALETAAREGEVKPYTGDTDLFITPGFQFHVVDAMITNFHLPKSTLMMLVSAFAGFDLIRQAYSEAVAARYRFFSYGDAMLIGGAAK